MLLTISMTSMICVVQDAVTSFWVEEWTHGTSQQAALLVFFMFPHHSFFKMSQTLNFFWWSSGFEHPWVSFIESFKLFRINILAQLWGWKIDACCWILALQPSSHRAIVTSLPCDDFAWFFWCVWFIELFEKINKIDSTLWICVECLFRSVGLGGVTPPPPLWSAWP